MNTAEAIRKILLETGKSKYRLSKDLEIAPIMIDNYLKGTRMGIKTYSRFIAKWDIKIDDVYDPVSHAHET